MTVGKGGGDMSSNTAIGITALAINSTGLQNTAIGYSSLQANTSGESNTAVGALSLRLNTVGILNTAVGNASLYKNTVGLANTAVGNASLAENTSGESNTAVGNYSLATNITGSHNTSLGSRAGRFLADDTTPNTAPTGSIFIGSDTKSSTASDTNQIVIGRSAVGNGSNTTTIGNTFTTSIHLHGDVNLKNATAPTTATITQTKYIPIVINGTTYKLLLGS